MVACCYGTKVHLVISLSFPPLLSFLPPTPSILLLSPFIPSPFYLQSLPFSLPVPPSFRLSIPPSFHLPSFSSGDSFDIADRTFRNIATTWWLSSSESTTDVKELIPEFFFLPEFLINTERMLISWSADVIMS